MTLFAVASPLIDPEINETHVQHLNCADCGKPMKGIIRFRYRLCDRCLPLGGSRSEGRKKSVNIRQKDFH